MLHTTCKPRILTALYSTHWWSQRRYFCCKLRILWLYTQYWLSSLAWSIFMVIGGKRKLSAIARNWKLFCGSIFCGNAIQGDHSNKQKHPIRCWFFWNIHYPLASLGLTTFQSSTNTKSSKFTALPELLLSSLTAGKQLEIGGTNPRNEQQSLIDSAVSYLRRRQKTCLTTSVDFHQIRWVWQYYSWFKT